MPTTYTDRTPWTIIDTAEHQSPYKPRKPVPPESAEQGGGCRVVRRTLHVGEAARDALGKTFAEPVTNVVAVGFRLLEGRGGGAAAAEKAEQVDQVCEVAKAVVDPASVASSVVDKAVRHCTAQVLAAPLGPIGVGIAFFAGKLASELTHQALDTGGDAAGTQGIELTGMVADASLGRLAESDVFRDYLTDLLSQPVIAILPSGTPAAHGQQPGHEPGHEPGHRAAQPATIRGVLVAYKVNSPAARHPAGYQEASGAAAPSGDSPTIQVQPASYAFACVPEGAVAERRTWTSYHPDPLKRENLLLTDGTLIERHTRGGVPGPWARVSDRAARTDQQEAKELPERGGHELTSQFNGALPTTPPPVDADLLAAYRALKEWATRHGVQ